MGEFYLPFSRKSELLTSVHPAPSILLVHAPTKAPIHVSNALFENYNLERKSKLVSSAAPSLKATDYATTVSIGPTSMLNTYARLLPNQPPLTLPTLKSNSLTAQWERQSANIWRRVSENTCRKTWTWSSLSWRLTTSDWSIWPKDTRISYEQFSLFLITLPS